MPNANNAQCQCESECHHGTFASERHTHAKKEPSFFEAHSARAAGVHQRPDSQQQLIPTPPPSPSYVILRTKVWRGSLSLFLYISVSRAKRNSCELSSATFFVSIDKQKQSMITRSKNGGREKTRDPWVCMKDPSLS